MNFNPRPNRRKSDQTWYNKIWHKVTDINNNGQAAEDFEELVEKSDRDDEQPLTAQEKEYISAVLEFGGLEAEDVAVPRSDIIYVQGVDDFDQILDTFKESRHSRLPVCAQNMDFVTGFITLKDMLPFVEQKSAFTIKKVVRSCPFVPGTMPLNDVLQIMRKERVQMAMVVDEYGGLEGLLTLKDILKKLVGSITDEHEQIETGSMIKEIGVDRYALDPRVRIEELVKKFRVLDDSWLEADFDTVGGLAMHLAGKVPAVGEEFTLPKKRGMLKVTSADGRRVRLLELAIIKKR